MKNLLSIVFICIFIFSCKNHKESEKKVGEVIPKIVEVKDVDLDPPTLVDMNKYVDSVKFVKLETNGDNNISSITELFFTEEFIIVLDALTGSIHFFNNTGKYIQTISKRGNGPGEYTRISRLIVDVESKILMVYDINQRKLIKYDFHGTHICTLSNFGNGEIIRDIIMLPDGRFLCYRQDSEGGDKQKAGLWTVSKDGSFEKYIYTINDTYPLVFTDNWYNLYKLPNGEIGFVDQNQINIYYIKNDSVIKRIGFTVPGKSAADFKGIEKVSEDFFMIMNSQEKGGYIFTDWANDKSEGFVSVVSKSDGSIEEGLAFSPLMNGYFIPGGKSVRNNSLTIHTSWLSTHSLTPYLGEKVPLLIREVSKKLLAGMTEQEIEESNPIIQMLYIKE